MYFYKGINYINDIHSNDKKLFCILFSYMYCDINTIRIWHIWHWHVLELFSLSSIIAVDYFQIFRDPTPPADSS